MPPIQAVALGGLLLVGLAILGAALYTASIGIHRIRTARTLGEAGPIPLADVPSASGLVEFVGTARSSESEGESLEAPLSGKSCLAYTIRSRRFEGVEPSGADEDLQWSIDGGASASVPFVVEDGRERVTVDPTNAVLSLDWGTAETEWRDRSALPAATRARLATVGLPGVDGSDGGADPEIDGNDGRADPETDGSDGRADSGTETLASGEGDAKATAPGDIDRQYREQRLEAGTEVRVFGASVTDSSEGDGWADAPVTVGGDDWFEITAGETTSGGRSVLSDGRRSGSFYVIFGGLLAIPGVGLTLAGIAGLVTVVGF